MRSLTKKSDANNKVLKIPMDLQVTQFKVFPGGKCSHFLGFWDVFLSERKRGRATASTLGTHMSSCPSLSLYHNMSSPWSRAVQIHTQGIRIVTLMMASTNYGPNVVFWK